MSNLLANELSPYLRQHANNPVHWRPWSDSAFKEAAELDRPVFLSIGYSSCHWCHVMEHESFEDDQVAVILNRSFISVKVDREELPEVDEAYMNFVQLATGRGGWPMSVFLLPDRSPIFAGTYWPREDRGAHLGFRSILLWLEELWKADRAQLEQAGAYHRGILAQSLLQPFSRSKPTGRLLRREDIASMLAPTFDAVHGGFGSKPKFPPYSALQALLELPDGRPMALHTLRAIAMGGIHDHVGGGFHRYSTDAEWHLPHFEKMLYDNALLLDLFSQAAQSDLDPAFPHAASGIVAWLTREMETPDGLFCSGLDADSEGEEGTFYVWDYADLPDDARFAADYGCHPEGNFQDEATGSKARQNVLHRQPGSPIHEPALEVLLAKRAQRPRPSLDHKAIVAWNGLAITGLVRANQLDLAARCAESVLEFSDGGLNLPRYVAEGKAVGAGYLEDHAHFARSLFALAARRPKFLEPAITVGSRMVDGFFDEMEGGFFTTSDRHELLFGRSKPTFDQPIPSANSAALEVLWLLGDTVRAIKSVSFAQSSIQAAPLACLALLRACGTEELKPHVAVRFATLSNDQLRINLSIDLSAPWTAELLEVTAGDTVLLAQPSAPLNYTGPGHALPEQIHVRYRLCSDELCLPERTIVIPLPAQN